jgi:iron complex outermembrane receptor protein
MRIAKSVITPVLIGTALSSLIHVVAVAQDSRQAQLEEVIVTATKRESNLQDVPIAVTALSGRDLV